MDLENALAHLRTLNEVVPRPMRLPTPEEVDAAEKWIERSFHPDLRKYLLEASDIVYGTKEPVTLTRAESHTDFHKVCDHAWNRYGVPRQFVPFCEDNADFFCLNGAGEVVFWSHNGWSSEKWPDLATWIEECWIDESA